MNKALLLFLLSTIVSVSNAGVFKCTGDSGKTIYQNDPCPSTASTSTVAIEEIDPDTVRLAQERLDLQLQQQAEIDANNARDALLEREVEALERSAYADEERAETERLQAEGQFQGQQDNSNQYYPYYSYYPRKKHRDYNHNHPDHNKPRPQPYVKKPGKISIKIK